MAKKKERQTLGQCKAALREHIDTNYGSQRVYADHMGIHKQTITRILGNNNHKPTDDMLDEMNWKKDPETYSQK